MPGPTNQKTPRKEGIVIGMRWVPAVLLAALLACGTAAVHLVSEISSNPAQPDLRQVVWLIVTVVAVNGLGLACLLSLNPRPPRPRGRRRRP